MRFRKRAKTEQKGNGMKRLFRRNQIIITTLAVMIAAAGYLNYAGKQELETGTSDMAYDAGSMEISDEELYMENQTADYEVSEGNGQTAEPYAPGEAEEEQSFASGEEERQQLAEIDSWDMEEAGVENPGEAVLTNGLTVSDYIAGVQLNREQIRARNKETLNSIINNVNIDEAAKQEAIQNMIAMTEVAEKENAAETLLQAKGFSDPVVSMTEGKVDVVINAGSITDQQRAQIEDIVKRKTMTSADSIVITLLKLEE